MNSKPTGYLALVAQREALDAQINAAREAEREAAIGQIKELMKEFDLSVLDLQEKVHKRKPRRMSTAPMYRDPTTVDRLPEPEFVPVRSGLPASPPGLMGLRAQAARLLGDRS